jgi:hypothetical protein
MEYVDTLSPDTAVVETGEVRLTTRSSLVWSSAEEVEGSSDRSGDPSMAFVEWGETVVVWRQLCGWADRVTHVPH